eukprot:375307-Amphidinium_carterae.1
MSHFTPFVEDVFAALTGLIFLRSAITNPFKAYVDETAEVTRPSSQHCFALAPACSQYSCEISRRQILATEPFATRLPTSQLRSPSLHSLDCTAMAATV